MAGKKALFLQAFLGETGGCNNSDGEAAKGVSIYTAITEMEFHTFILSFCQ